MKQLPTAAFWVYIGVAMLELVAEWFGLMSLHHTVKPMLMPLIMLFYYSSARGQWNGFHTLMMVAFAFSFIGDVALMKGDYFLIGLGAFLITHILYTIAFTKGERPEGHKSALRKRPFIVVPWIVLAFSLISYVMNAGHPDLEAIKIPVIIYAAVITTMVIVSLTRYGRVSQSSFILVSLGAILFMFSDSIIAVSRFTYFFADMHAGIPRVLIMGLYIAGQMLIARGCLLQFNIDKLKKA